MNNNLKIILRDTGQILIIVGIASFFVNIVGIIFKEIDYIKWFILMSFIFLLVGYIFSILGKTDYETRVRHAMITAALCWIILSMVSAIPFCLIPDSDGLKLDYLSALFEGTAGWSGTGLSMYSQPSKLPHILQFWRSFSQWIGSAGIIVLAIVVLFRPGSAAFALYKSEGREEKIRPSVISTAKIIWVIYLFYTVIGIIILFLLRMPLWEAINHGMTAIATGGFSIRDDSLVSYSSPVKFVIIILMIFGATSFFAHYELLYRKIKKFIKDMQVQAMFLIILIGLIILPIIGKVNFFESAFQFISAITTTGFSTANIANWSENAKFLLSLAMIIGGAAGSTAGGIKLIRLVLLFKGAGWKLKKAFLPARSAFPYKFGRDFLLKEEAMEILGEASVISFLWIILIISGSLIVSSSTGQTLINSFFEVCSAQGGVGLSVGITNLGMAGIAKFMLILNMWIGRLEIIPFLVLLRSIFQFISGRKFY